MNAGPVPRFANAVMGQITLRADGEELVLRYDTGRIRVSGMLRAPVVSFGEYACPEGSGQTLGFLRRHDVVDVVYRLLLTAFGVGPREVTLAQCRLDDFDYIEAEDGNRIEYRLLVGEIRGEFWGAEG